MTTIKATVLRRLATHSAWALAVPVGVLLALAIVTAHMLSAAGHARDGAPASMARATGRGTGGNAMGESRAGDPTGSVSSAGTAIHLRGTPVSVSVAAHPLGAGVPADFLGLSFEMRSLPTIAGYAARGNLVGLLRSLGSGVLRFGGISADEQVAWVGPRGSRPGWASVGIAEADLAGLAALARETGWRVLLTVNLAHYDPPAAAQEAAAAQRLLGGYLAGIEIGNEPDLFVGKHLRPAGWGFREYASQAAAYRAAIQAAAPGVTIAGPDPATGVGGLRWLHAVAASPTLRPGLLTDHYYPLSSCGGSPTVSELLSPNVRRSESGMLQKMIAIAHGAALRVDETNDISCEGEPGVSNTFASALWALDYTARAIAAGVVGLNFHDLIAKPRAYSPLFTPNPAALTGGDPTPPLHAAPEWYALLAARAFISGPESPATGPGAPGQTGERPLPTSVAGAAPGELSASALHDAPSGRLAIVLVDYDPPGSTPLAVSLRVPRDLGNGSVLRLTAPSPTATSGVRLGGRVVAPDGSFTAPPALPGVSGRAGSLAVAMPPDSAAVVTLSPTGAVGREALPR